MRPNLAVTVAAASRSMVKLAAVKTEIGNENPWSDAKIDRVIVAASLALAASPAALAIDPRGGSGPWLQTYAEKLPGDGGSLLYPSRWPLVSVASVTRGTGASPATVDPTLYSIDGQRRALYKPTLWARDDYSGPARLGGRPLGYNLAYEAGWLMPDQLVPWEASKVVAVGQWRTKKTPRPDEAMVFRVTAVTGDATTGTAEPAWPAAIGGTVTETTAGGTVVWTAYEQRLPYQAEEAALVTVLEWLQGGLEIPAGVASERAEAWAIQYRDGIADSIPPHAAALCRQVAE